jgi:hypothetical protein
MQDIFNTKFKQIMKKLITIVAMFVSIFVTNLNAQTNLGKTFNYISKQKSVTEIDTSSVTKFIKSVPKSNIIVINFFDENLVSNTASLTFLSQIDTDNCIKELDTLFVRYVTNGWRVNSNEVIIFEGGSFYHILVNPYKKTIFIK